MLCFSLDLTFRFTGDQQNANLGLEQRVFFENEGQSCSVTRSFNKNQQQCINTTAYIRVCGEIASVVLTLMLENVQ